MDVLVILAAIAAQGIRVGDARKQASEYFPICHRNDPDLNGCVKNVIEVIRPTLKKGVPELNLVPLEPLVIPRMEYEEGTGNFRFKQVMTNMKMLGLSNYVVRGVKVDLDALRLEVDLFTPTMQFEFDYEMEGKILLLPIQGSGDGIFNFTDIITVAHIDLKKVMRKGEEYLEADKIKWDIDVGNARTYFNNLFNGDKTLGKATNDFLNENWREAFKTYKHLPEQAFASSYFNICHKTEPEFTKCVLDTLQELKPKLIKGIPELDIVPIDPMHIPRMEINQAQGPLQFKSAYSNITVYGLGDTKIHSFSMDIENLILYTNASVPFMRFQCNYELEGKVLLLPVKGNGDAEFNFTDVFVSGAMKGKLEKRNGEDYLLVNDINFDTEMKNSHVQLNNLFNGDKVLGEATNKVFNENWREIFVTYKHIVEEAVGELSKNLANKVFIKFPFKELYPD
ncbi:hypothetical protein L9F63_005959 [Diploptera punctata]|uniref:Uncharacterized protein n=1 Tax=Diploptera punctata TaxID=6984 RepID=A0AAD7ZBF6_DIPPU|nr:hypothetical protein L9F63_005959 [Diploptera punctata]